MKTWLVFLASMLLIAGCCMAPAEEQPPQGGAAQPPGNITLNVSLQQNASTNVSSGEAAQNASGGQPPAQQYSGTAYSQADCATLTPTCETCLAKKNCGWCKSSNSCFIGDADGPDVSSCPAGDWTVTMAGCAAPAGGGDCSAQTNCVSCLSGSACKWCIHGSKCADASSTEDCFGGWLTVSYQCNYASR